MPTARCTGALLAFLLGCCAALPRPALADESGLSPSPLSTPYEREMRAHTYGVLRKSPAKALAWELALPGAGNLYTGVRVNAWVTIGVGVAGAAMWVAGSVGDDPPLMWAGIGTFAAGRSYGLVTAPWGAALLNAAFRRQLGLAGSF